MASLVPAGNVGRLAEFKPRVLKEYERLREIWDNAPTVAALLGSLSS